MSLRDIAQLFGRVTGSISEGRRRKDYAYVRAREIASQTSLVPPERQNAVVDKPGRRWHPGALLISSSFWAHGYPGYPALGVSLDELGLRARQ
jgi:hypothetical protein